MKVTLVLRNEHEALMSLIDKVKKSLPTRNPNGKKLLRELQQEIQMHSQVASEVFYSALAASPSDKAVELASTAQKKCQAVDRILQELNGMNPSDRNFQSKMDALIAEVGRHIELEEEELFQEARKTLPEYRLEELGLEMRDRRKILTMLAATA